MGSPADTRGASETVVGIFVDYESPLARGVAGKVWSGLSRAALDAGYEKTTARWESLREPVGPGRLEGPSVHVFAVGQDRPDAIDAVGAAGAPGDGGGHLYGLVLAVPERPSTLAGSLLYQGVGRLTDAGVRAGAIEPALLHAAPAECEAYARRLLERLREARRSA